MDKAEIEKVATEIAAAIGETEARPRAQIARMIGLMGEEWVRGWLETARAFYNGERGESALSEYLLYGSNGAPRTFGGVFFAWARRVARDHVAKGEMKRRDFWRCFHDRPPRPKEEKPAKAPRPKERPRGRAHDRRPKPTMPEVYNVVRRAAR